RSHERIDYRVLFGPNLTGTAQRDLDRSDASACSFRPKKRRPTDVVSCGLRDSLLWHHGLRCCSARRDCRSIGRTFPVEIQFCLSPWNGDWLAFGFMGLPVSTM